jgi:hypothetical protein
MAHAWWRDSDYELFNRLTRDRDALKAELAALKASLAPIPGVTDGTRDNEPYTLEDCEAIEKVRGKPYTRLRTTVETIMDLRHTIRKAAGLK